MARAWLVDGRGFAGKVKNATQLSASQIQDSGATRDCPNCGYHIDNSDVSIEWPGLPAGVKFDPSDLELLQHLAGKIGFRNARSHVHIDEFIPTLEYDEGICYTHPENLPGSKRDGSSAHFFHRTSKAYATGQRKRRKIHGQSSLTTEGHVRWHKTGKTKAVMNNGLQYGWKKIMVLYKSSKKGLKPDKSNWVMHQYHLGPNEDENDGEFVVSKIFYQQQPMLLERGDPDTSIEESVVTISRAGPTTPNTFTPNPPRQGKHPRIDETDEEYLNHLEMAVLDEILEGHVFNTCTQVDKRMLEATHPPQEVNIFKVEQAVSPHEANNFEAEQAVPPQEAINFEGEQADSVWLAGETQAADLDNDVDGFLSCHEILDSGGHSDDFRLPYAPMNDIGYDLRFYGSNSNRSEMAEDLNTAWEARVDDNTNTSITDTMDIFNSQDLLDMLNNPGW